MLLKSCDRGNAALLSMQQKRLERVQKVINEYTDNGWYRQETMQEIHGSIQEEDGVSKDLAAEFSHPTITARDIILPPYSSKPGLRNQLYSGATNLQQVWFDSYLSTPKFIKRLTDISEELIT